MKILKAVIWSSAAASIGYLGYTLSISHSHIDGSQHRMLLLAASIAAFLALFWIGRWLVSSWLPRLFDPIASSSPLSDTRYAQAGSLPMVKLATLDLHLDDPVDRQAFEQFLDQPIFSASEAHVSAASKTPSQIFEDAILSYVQEAEAEFGGTFSIKVKLHRGSFTIGLTFFAAYEFIAQYHDFVESISIIRRQIRELVQDASKWYRQQAGRDIRVRSNVSIQPPLMDVQDGDGPDGIGQPKMPRTQPNIETRNMQDAPSNVNDVNINVHARSTGALAAFLFTGFILTLFAGIAGAIYCVGLPGGEFCLQHVVELVTKFQNMMR